MFSLRFCCSFMYKKYGYLTKGVNHYYITMCKLIAAINSAFRITNKYYYEKLFQNNKDDLRMLNTTFFPVRRTNAGITLENPGLLYVSKTKFS